MRSVFTFALMCLASAAIAQEPAPPAAPAPPTAPAAAPAAPEAQPTPERTADEILKAARAQWDTIQAYHVKIKTWSRLGTKTNTKVLDFHFKRPHLVRSKVVAGDDNVGGVAVRNAKGELHGKKGGVLGLIVLTLEETDERILNLRGVKFYHADWGTILKDFSAEVDKGWSFKRLPDEKIENVDCHVLEVINPQPEEGKVSRDVLWIDPKTNLIKQRLQFEKDVKVSDTIYNDVELNIPIDDSLFQL